ncbi:acyltransferase [Streptococcus equinus]|uniref:Acetyltransferase (Isoleucine patch superfamily) n=1 Tax=Streptococcus equinus TaxID=1335 RepID=A0AAE8HJP0_STREI|nr:DapH/DapD/GlmU-related protein [Streptococcus equinus]SDW23252.1 Acetyltransferase (isoleucine patch superfamily) [Streptococcus equinus]
MKRIIEEGVRVEECVLGNRNWIRLHSSIKNCRFGDNIFIGFYSNIQNTSLGQGIQIASNVSCGRLTKDRVIIEDFVWIGAQAIIDPGVVIHKGAVVGARTHVTQDVPEFSIIRFDKVKQKNVVYPRNIDMDKAPELGTIFDYFFEKQNEKCGIHEGVDGNYISTSLSNEMSYLGKSNIFIGGFNGGVAIGDKVTIGDMNIFEGAGKIYIGENSVIGNNNHILSNSHDYKKLSLPMTFASVRIGRNVVIGDNVLVFPGISISDNTEIPSGSIVLHDI